MKQFENQIDPKWSSVEEKMDNFFDISVEI